MFEDLVSEYNSVQDKLNENTFQHRSYMRELHKKVWLEVKPIVGNNGRFYLSENFWVAPDCWSPAFERTPPEEIIKMVREYIQNKIDESLQKAKQLSDENKWMSGLLHPIE